MRTITTDLLINDDHRADGTYYAYAAQPAGNVVADATAPTWQGALAALHSRLCGFLRVSRDTVIVSRNGDQFAREGPLDRHGNLAL